MGFGRCTERTPRVHKLCTACALTAGLTQRTVVFVKDGWIGLWMAEQALALQWLLAAASWERTCRGGETSITRALCALYPADLADLHLEHPESGN